MEQVKWRREGHCKVSLRDGQHLSLRRTEYPKLTTAWKKGDTFGEFTGVYDYKITIKFAEVNAIMDCGPEAIAEETEDNKLEEMK